MHLEPWAHWGGGACSTSHTDTVSEQRAPFHPNGHRQLQSDKVRRGEEHVNTVLSFCYTYIHNIRVFPVHSTEQWVLRVGFSKMPINKKKTNQTFFLLTTQTSRSLHMSLRCCSEYEHTAWLHTDPRCARRLDVPQAVPELGTFRLSLCETAREKCTLSKKTWQRITRETAHTKMWLRSVFRLLLKYYRGKHIS